MKLEIMTKYRMKNDNNTNKTVNMDYVNNKSNIIIITQLQKLQNKTACVPDSALSRE